MQLVYSGAHDEVEVPDAGIVAQRGVPVEVEDEVAKRLLEQDTWARAGKPETAEQRKARVQAEKDQAEQDRAAEQAADEARAKVAADQAAARQKGNS